MVCAKEAEKQHTLLFNYSDLKIERVSYFRPILRKFFEKICDYIKQSNIKDTIFRKLKEDVTAFESYAAREILSKNTTLSNDFVIIRVNNPQYFADSLSEFAFSMSYKILVIDYYSSEAVLLINNSTIPVPNINELEVMFANVSIKINAIGNNEITTMEIMIDDNKIETPPSSRDMYGKIPIMTCELTENSWKEAVTDCNNSAFCYYILNTLHQMIGTENSKIRDDVFSDIDLCSLVLPSSFNQSDSELKLITAKSKTLLKLENCLHKYYQSIKFGVALDKEET